MLNTWSPAGRLRRAHAPVVLAVAWRNVRLRYKSSILGFVWSLLNPLLFLLIFLFIFSRAFPQVENYAVFALTGLIFWSFFATSSAPILGSLVESAHVLRSLAVPPIVFPLAQLLAGLFNLLLSFVPFAGILLVFGWQPTWNSLLVLPALLLFSVFLFGLGLLLAALNVFFRDIGLLWGALLPAFFYITPIAYPPDLVPDDLAWVAGLNPLYHYISLFRSVVYEGAMGTGAQWGLTALIALVALFLGWSVHRALRRGYIANY